MQREELQKAIAKIAKKHFDLEAYGIEIDVYTILEQELLRAFPIGPDTKLAELPWQPVEIYRLMQVEPQPISITNVEEWPTPQAVDYKSYPFKPLKFGIRFFSAIALTIWAGYIEEIDTLVFIRGSHADRSIS